MLDHQRKRHGPQMRENKDQMSEMTIPSTPFLGLRERQDERPKTKKQKKEDKGEKRNKTETVSVVPSTPEKLDDPSLDESFSMMPSPASILLGFEDHIEVSPIKGRLQSLFEPPARAVSPLPLTPERSQVSNNKETFIVIEDPALNDLDHDIISSDVAKSTKRDSSHLVLPNATTVQEGKIHNRFLAPPSSFQTTNEAAIVRSIRSKAVRSENYKGSVIPYGYAGVKKEEKVVFPDGTVYYLSAFWIADPQLSTNITVETQTPLMMLPSRMVTSSVNTDQLDVRDAHTTGSTTRTIETQTDDREEINSIEDDFSYFS